MGEQETISVKRKILIVILLPLLISSFLSVGYSQLTDTSIISMSGSDWSLKVDSVLASSIDSRNTPYMTAKSSTEKELFLELATLEDCKSGVVQFKIDMQGLTAYKQLPLTQKEIDEGNYRPKNVENSFALFDDSGKKVAHIYGSKITDAKGVEVWLDQNLQDGLLTVFLPKPEVLETLTFPLLLDPTFGYSNEGASRSQIWSATVGGNATLSESGQIIGINVYLNGTDTKNVRAGIYYQNLTRIATTNIVVGDNNDYEWIYCDFASPLSLEAGTYYLAVTTNNNDAFYAFDSVATYYLMLGTGTLPDPLDGSTWSEIGYRLSIYANYTTVEPTPTPSPSPSPSYTPFPEGDMSNTDWWISILVLLLIIINIFLMMLPFALVRFTFGILSLFLCMLALSYQIPLSPYLQTAGLLISALAMLFSVRARE